MSSLSFSINAVLPVFLIIAAGYLLARYGVLDKKFSDTASRFVFLISLPLLLFSSAAKADFSGLFNKDLFLSITVVIISTLLVFAAVYAVGSKRIRDGRERGAFIQGAFRGNCALFGIPLVYNIASDEGVVIISLVISFLIPLYNILAVIALSVHEKRRFRDFAASIIKNPLIIAVAAGIAVSASRLKIPAVFVDTMDMLSVLAIPLALLSIGIFFDLGRFVSKLKISLAAAAVKTLAVPLVFTPLAYLSGIRGIYLAVVFVLFAAPTAVSSYIMAKGSGSDEELSGSIIIVSTAMSLITVFAGIYILKSLGFV